MITAAALLLGLCGIVYALDPFYHYHAPWFGLTPVLADKEYQVVGTLRHFDYNAVIAGSSVTENNDNRWFNETFGVTSIKAARSYGGIADLVWLCNEAFDTHHVEQVYFNIDPAGLVQPPETTFEMTGCPMYLYDHNPFNDIRYLLNTDVLFNKIPYMILQSLRGYDANLSYNWAEGKDFSRTGALTQYERQVEMDEMQEETTYDHNLQGNIALLTAMVEAHPETQFRFYIPPYSALWWDSVYRSGMQDVYIHCEEETLRALLTYDNVLVYDFQNEEDVVTDLDLYMDTVHFSPAINHEIVTWLAEGHAQVTEENIADVFARTRDFARRNLTENIAPLEEQDAFRYEEQ